MPIRFTQYNKLFLSVSAGIIVLLFVATLIRGGFNFGIDFSSGVVFTVISDTESRELEQKINPLFEKPIQVQSLVDNALYGQQKRFSLKLANNAANIADFEKQARKKIDNLSELTIEGSNFVSPTQSAYLRWQTWVLTFFVFILILLYVWYRFQLRYAVAALVALLHDALILLGVIGTFQLDFSSTTIAAILTVIGYSLNDTIVVFDRIRENRMTMHTSNLRDIVDYSVTATLSRTLITSLTTLLAVLAIYFFAYGSVKLFALELIIGVLVGTYSSIYIASSLVLFFDLRRRKVLESAGKTNSKNKVAAKGSNKSGVGILNPLNNVGVKKTYFEKDKKVNKPNLAIKQTAEEIRLSTEAKRKKREVRRKKKK